MQHAVDAVRDYFTAPEHAGAHACAELFVNRNAALDVGEVRQALQGFVDGGALREVDAEGEIKHFRMTTAEEYAAIQEAAAVKAAAEAAAAAEVAAAEARAAEAQAVEQEVAESEATTGEAADAGEGEGDAVTGDATDVPKRSSRRKRGH